MQYTYRLSERAIDVLAQLEQPSKKTIERQKSEEYLNEVGTDFKTIQKNLGLSIHQLRRLLQEELYGVVGVFFQRFDGHCSTIYIGTFPDFEQLRAISDSIEKEGFDARYTESGRVYKSKSKIISRQKGLYIPECIQEKVEMAVDNENLSFAGEIEPSTLPILEHVLKKSLDLRSKHGNNWYPVFSDASIARDLNMPLEEVQHATSDGTGILCEEYQMVTCRKWRKRFFLPSCRYGTVEDLLYQKPFK
ncbi:hypothetical protein HYU07_07760 [Candidatus Woesearchaeota archaeon]|nr:hypothetical protein [Candidatus Woesearchaeota archaeon]